MFHNHYVALHEVIPEEGVPGIDEVVDLCPGLEVKDITFQEPGDVDIVDRRAVMEDVPYYFAGTHSLTGDQISFLADENVGAVVSFTINPVDGTGTTSVTDIQAVCINDVSAVHNQIVKAIED